jgi:serine/threonine protein kinase
VYLVKEISDTSSGQSLNATVHGGEGAAQRGSGSGGASAARSGSIGNGSRRSIGNDSSNNNNNKDKDRPQMVLKVTSILSRQQRDIAEKEAKLLSRLSHPSIIKMFDTCYRTVAHEKSSRRGSKVDPAKERPQHLILMEYCEGGHALEVCTRMAATGARFDLSTLIIAFGQICNAVSYLHAQRPPIVHRDLKPANFLVKNGAYKLCDFGSAVFGHVDLKTPAARAEAEEEIQKTTTQMFRAPEMVDLYMAKKLTQATDVWALGCCLYSLAFLQNCFEEGSNLAILSRKYRIPDDNPYGDGLVELIDRMLTIDSKERADMTEVILCLSAVYSGRDLPPRRERKKEKEKKEEAKAKENAGTFRTDGQGVYGDDLEIDPKEIQKSFPSKSAKPLKSNSAAARRKAAAESGGAVGGSDLDLTSLHSKHHDAGSRGKDPFGGDPFAGSGDSLFASFEGSGHAPDEIDGITFSNSGGWDENEVSGRFDAFASFSPDTNTPEVTEGNADDEDDQENGDEDNEGKPRRRKSNSGRKSRSSATSDPQDKGESADDGPKRTVRRTRSTGGTRRRSGSADIEAMAASRAKAEGDAEDNDDSRRRSSTNRVRRAQPSTEALKAGSTSTRGSGGSSSRRDSNPRTSTRRDKDGDRDKDSSIRSRGRLYSEDDQ